MTETDKDRCEHCANELIDGRVFKDKWCSESCYSLAKAEYEEYERGYERSEYELARQLGENNFPSHPTPDPSEER